MSSKIEGTQATIGEVLEFEAGAEPASAQRRDDIVEVLNYRMAMRHAEQMLGELPLSQRVIRHAHAVLLSGVRGHGKSPGEYRRIPNWIGTPGAGIEQAKFIPIDAHLLHNAMSKWERYIHADAPDRLVQLAILHAEFEALHPFLDGNGRLGRMLVPLFLWCFELIRAPVFYISAWFEARRDEYYERLLAVSRDDDWTGWCRFFLKAVHRQPEENSARARAILELRANMEKRVARVTRSHHTVMILDWMFARPVFKSVDFQAAAGIPKSTAWRILKALRDTGILQTVIKRRGSKSSVLLFPALLRIAEGDHLP